MKIRTYILYFLFFSLVVVLGGCSNEADQMQTQKEFRSEYISNINNILDASYNLSGWYINSSGKNYINTEVSNVLDLSNYGIFGLLKNIDPNELFKFSNTEGFELDLNSKYLSKFINENISSKDYHFVTIKPADITWKGKYIDNKNDVILDIESLKINNVYITGQIGSGIIELYIDKGVSNIYIKNSLTGGHIYSSGLMDFEIMKI